MIKYLGSKRTLIPLITRTIRTLSPPTTVFDMFSGSSRVGCALKAGGYQVTSCDINQYAATIAQCYIEQNSGPMMSIATEAITELNKLTGKRGYFTETFCENSRFFQPKNGARVDAIRELLEARGAQLTFAPGLKSVLLVSLMEAADRVDSTVGLQMAYLKRWAPRAHNDLQLRCPLLLPPSPLGPGLAICGNIIDVVGQVETEIAYIDPPYNQHKYLGNYHIWETLVRWDKPEHYGIACKRMDCKKRKSPFNSKPRFERSNAPYHRIGASKAHCDVV